MSQRSRTKTVAAVYAAFLRRKTWIQADLARTLGVGTEALRKVLDELVVSGVPLESERDHPHVYWRMSRSWYPGGVLFPEEAVPDLFRHLARMPRSKARDRLLTIAVDQLPAKGRAAATPAVVSRPISDQEERFEPLLEEATARREALWLRHVSTSRGCISERFVSVHLLDLGPPSRFVATCHRTGELRWFRVDNVLQARPERSEPFREAGVTGVAAFRRTSLDGFKGRGAALPCSFVVREPDSKWVANNLLEGMRAETLPDGIRVTLETSAVVRLARFVVGLGGAAEAETPELRAVVLDLARGAISHASARSEASEGDEGRGRREVARRRGADGGEGP